MRGLFVVLFACLAVASHPAVADTGSDARTFALPAPATGSAKPLLLWATYYHVWPADETDDGLPLLDASNHSNDHRVSLFDWCKGAIQGTITITTPHGGQLTYNYADQDGPMQVDCATVLSIDAAASPWIGNIGKTRFRMAHGVFGDGVRDYRLVPYRTVAVDPSKIPYGSLIYIPRARGTKIVLPNGESYLHDGYFFAADTGSAIKNGHIDVFSGVSTDNPFPAFVHSRETPAFDAYVVDDEGVRDALQRLHSP